jgi:acetolactate synthase-1/2/3 large subunit
MKYSNIIAKWLVELGYTHCFYVAGGGIMHLLDGFRNEFECIPVVHEVSAGICAEHFNQCSNKNQRAFALVTTGPGLTNIVTAIAGCYVEHRELLVISGQVKSTDLLTYPERQRGVQEVDGNAICAPISVKSACLTSPIKRSEFVKLVELSQGPHPGPVVIEICLDIQGAKVIPELLNDKSTHANSTVTIPTNEADIDYIVSLLMKASRPIILLGGLVSREIAWQALPMLERLGVPVATTTSAIDRIPSSSLIFAGRPGTWGGQRAANLVLAQADFILVLGAQLDLQQTGFNYTEYATTVNLIHVFPSEVELKRTGPTKLRGILASPDLVLVDLMEKAVWVDNESWNQYVKNIQELVPSIEAANTCDPEYVNSFIFLKNLSKASNPLDVLALCSSGGTFTGSLQNYEIATHQIATTSAAHASMGYGLATAIGAAFANPNQSVILTEGEGGFSQNFYLIIMDMHQ